MLPFALLSPVEMTRAVSARVRALRLQRGWTQAELAARAGLSPATYRLFERTGQISLERLLRVAIALEALDPFDNLFPPRAARSLAELERLAAASTRKRGRRRDAQT